MVLINLNLTIALNAGIIPSRSACTKADLHRFLFCLAGRETVPPPMPSSPVPSIHDLSFSAFLLHHHHFTSLFLTLSFHFNSLSSLLFYYSYKLFPVYCTIFSTCLRSGIPRHTTYITCMLLATLITYIAIRSNIVSLSSLVTINVISTRGVAI